MFEELAVLYLVPDSDPEEKRRTLLFLRDQMLASGNKPIEITFKVRREDLDRYISGARQDLKRWIARTRPEFE